MSRRDEDSYEEVDVSADFEIESKDGVSALTSPTLLQQDHEDTFPDDAVYDQDFFRNLQEDSGESPHDSSYQFSSMDLNFNVTSPTPRKKGAATAGKAAAPTFTSPLAGEPSVWHTAQPIPFYGRQAEIEQLEEAMERISLEWMENPSEVVFLTGPPGVGKTTLIQHVTMTRSLEKDHSGLLFCRGTCEQYATAGKPFQALTSCLNDLCTRLLQPSSGGKHVWKPRMEDALGGDIPLLCTICPQLRHLVDLKTPLDRRALMQFDTNLSFRMKRLALAVRDLLHAVSEQYALVMIVDNIHWADPDSLAAFQDILSVTPLQNFLLIAAYDEDPELADYHPMHPLHDMKAAIAEAAPTTETRTTEMPLQPFDSQQVQEMLSSLFFGLDHVVDNGPPPLSVQDNTLDNNVQDLTTHLFSISQGNPLWIITLLRLFKDKKLIVYQESDKSWAWKRKKTLHKEIKTWKEEKPQALSSLEGTIQERLANLPRKINFVLQMMGAMRLTQFRTDHLHRVLKKAYPKETKNEQLPIQTAAELEKFLVRACQYGVCQPMTSRRGGGAAGLTTRFRFVHDVFRECSALLIKESKQDTIRFAIGSELSVIATEVVQPEERDRFKLWAADQLNYCVTSSFMTQEERAKCAKLNLEAAEIAIVKTAFRTAVTHLEHGLAAVAESIRWQQVYYDVTMRTFLFLSRMRYCCGYIDESRAACEALLENAATLKDRVFAIHMLLIVQVHEFQFDDALEVLLDVLGQLGETFPTGDHMNNIIEREYGALFQQVSGLANPRLLSPPKMNDKKAADVMYLLATLAEIAPKCETANRYAEFATIRMMHISLNKGFTRQYPLAFSLLGIGLFNRGHVNQAMRMGQVAERIARVTDFYGGMAVVLFHWHLSHWRRVYKRNLQPILRIYNSQVDAGDFYHVGFTISTYIQYHLASGFDLARLADNMHLFHGLYNDYYLPNDSIVVVPQQVVSNLMAETVYPLLFFGDTIDQQETKLQEMEDFGQYDAIQYFYWMRLFIAFFFHDFQVMEESYEMLSMALEGVWIPWAMFFECYLKIQHLYGSKGRARKELKEQIETLKLRLVDWYNDGAPNPSAMVSILEVEWLIAKEAGKGLSALKVQQMFDEAIDAAASDGATHLEAFACERAGRHFHTTGVEGFCADYLARAHKAYDRWNAVAKVIDLEAAFGDKLAIRNRRQRPAAAYMDYNENAPQMNREIGGGQQSDLDGMTVQKALKGAKKIKKIGKIGKKARKVKDLFRKEKAEPAPWGWGSKTQQMSLEDDEVVSPTRPRSSLFGLKKSPTVAESEQVDTDSPKKSPRKSILSPLRSPGRGLKKIFGGKSKLPLTEEEDEVEEEEEKEEETEEKPSKKKSSKDKSKKKDIDEDDEEEDDDDSHEKKKKKKHKKKKKKESKMTEDANLDDDEEEEAEDDSHEEKKKKKKKHKKKKKKKKDKDNEDVEDDDSD